MDPNKALNMTMLCDFYELTMGNGYLEHGMQDRITYFDVFFRSVPDDGGYAIAAGLEQIIDYIENLHFTDEDIAYLRSRCSRASHSSRCARPPSRRSSWRRICCCRSTTRV